MQKTKVASTSKDKSFRKQRKYSFSPPYSEVDDIKTKFPHFVNSHSNKMMIKNQDPFLSK